MARLTDPEDFQKEKKKKRSRWGPEEGTSEAIPPPAVINPMVPPPGVAFNPQIGAMGGAGPMFGGGGPMFGGGGPMMGGAGPMMGGAGPMMGGASPMMGGASPMFGGGGPFAAGGSEYNDLFLELPPRFIQIICWSQFYLEVTNLIQFNPPCCYKLSEKFFILSSPKLFQTNK